jgi:hypothetical protein
MGNNLDDNYGGAFVDNHHCTNIFPYGKNGDCTRTMTLTAPAATNTWGEWAEIVDSEGNSFSDIFAERAGYIAAIVAETVSNKDKVAQFEFAIGDDKCCLVRFRAIAGDTKVSTDSGKNLRNPIIPAGQKVYYRMASEQTEMAFTGQIRYYFADGENGIEE